MREWADGVSVSPTQYGAFYLMCRDAIHSILGHEKDEVLIAAPGPWNNQYKYPGNPTGDWIVYFIDILKYCGKEVDGFSLHAYTHGYDVSLVTSEAMMDNPFQNRHYNFRVYQDFLNAIPDYIAHLPSYITETNGNGEWQAVGLIPAMAREIDTWNRKMAATGRKRLVKSLVCYRYPAYDQGIQFHMVGKPLVLNEYKEAVALNIVSPEVTSPTPSPLPEIGKGVVIAELLNVRNKPGVSGTQVVATLPKGQLVSIAEKAMVGEHLWLMIGKDQWVIAEWVRSGETVPLPTQSNWERSRSFTAKWEGEFQNHEWDIGNWTECAVGEGINKGTKYGISACSYPDLDIKNITRKQADDIYFQDYWVRSGADKLTWPFCLVVFDTAINFHPNTAKAWLQESNGDMLRFVGLRLRGYRRSKAWPEAGDAWVDRVIDLIMEATKQY